MAIAAKLSSINNLPSLNINLILPIFDSLNRYFEMVANAQDTTTLILDAAKQKFTNNAQDGVLTQLRSAAQGFPTPMNQWIEQIAGNAWYLILMETKKILNQEWKKQVLPEYTQSISNRFPLNNFAEQEISLESFSHFFNHSGTFKRFFDAYIQPFLDTTQAQWTPKKVDNASLPFKPETILAFERANVIREMFFPNNIEMPSVQFELQSTDLEPIVSRLTFDINGQKLVANQAEKTTQTFNWPGDYTHTPVTLTIQSISGENFQATEYGVWGLFRLLSHANVFPVSQDDTRKLEIVLDVNGNAAQYLLQANNPINPFIPNIMQGFVLSDELF
jgi:intracellular multiplication protein IcmF